jgi:hypothetical protein
MPERFDCTFIERRIDQLIDQAIELPDGSPEQHRIDRQSASCKTGL